MRRKGSLTWRNIRDLRFQTGWNSLEFGGQEMKFNYNTEKKKYIRKWEVLEKEYETAGMDKSSIEEMKRFD